MNLDNNVKCRKQTRAIKFTPHINPYALGSVMAEFGNTKVHITVSLEEGVPHWMKGKGQGWITAEYNMLPGATHTRSKRERNGPGGRTQEIQRLIGRCLRTIVDLKKLGENSIFVDCDVIVADGGTRTTSISGAYVALVLATRELTKRGLSKENPLKEAIAAVSVGIDPQGNILADLNYQEDSSCHTDMNFVMTKSGKFVEIQGTAEKDPFNKDQLMVIMSCAEESLKEVFNMQDQVLSL